MGFQRIHKYAHLSAASVTEDELKHYVDMVVPDLIKGYKDIVEVLNEYAHLATVISGLDSTKMQIAQTQGYMLYGALRTLGYSIRGDEKETAPQQKGDLKTRSEEFIRYAMAYLVEGERPSNELIELSNILMQELDATPPEQLPLDGFDNPEPG